MISMSNQISIWPGLGQKSAILAISLVATACAQSSKRPANQNDSEVNATDKNEKSAPLDDERPASEVFAAPAVVGAASALSSAPGSVLTVRGAPLVDPSMCTKNADGQWRPFFMQATDIGKEACLEIVGSTLVAGDARIEFDVRGTIIKREDGSIVLKADSAIRSPHE
jgi:hypothetical protein